MRLAVLLLAALPCAAMAQDGAATVIGALDAGHLLVARDGKTFVCALSATGDTYTAQDCKEVAIALPGRTADRDLFIATFEANGCQISEKDAPGILLPLGFTKEQVGALVDVLKSEGKLVMDEGNRMATLKTGKCN